MKRRVCAVTSTPSLVIRGGGVSKSIGFGYQVLQKTGKNTNRLWRRRGG